MKTTVAPLNRRRPAEAVYRSVMALVSGNTQPGGEGKYLRSLGDDPATAMMIRAATSGGTLGDEDWAGVLASEAVADFFASLGPSSAASELMARSLSLSFPDGIQSIKAPGIIPAAIAGGFVAEGEPGTVRQWSITGPTLTPKKILILAAVSRELAKRSRAEAIVRDALRQSSALTLDAALFSDDAATDAAPAGLLNGVSATTADTGGDDQALRNNMAAVAAVVAPIAAGRIVFVASPEMAVKIALLDGALAYDVLPSAALPEGTIAAVAPDALVFAVNPVPIIDVSAEATLHMEDLAPGQISAIGTPNVVAAPVQSLFQTAQIGIRLMADVSWAKRHANAIAYTTVTAE